jgi:hypothetical protein
MGIRLKPSRYLTARNRIAIKKGGHAQGQKTPFKLKEIWAIRVRLQMANRCRELALFNLAIDSKLRACDLMQLKVRDVCHGQTMAFRALVLQQKTQRPVQFEITEPTRDAVLAWITYSQLKPEDFLFPSRIRSSPHLPTIGIGYHKLRYPHA